MCGRCLIFTLFILQCDQAKEGLVNNASQMDEYCSDKGFINWFETSAKEDINISEAAKYLVSKVRSQRQDTILTRSGPLAARLLARI